MHRHYYKLWVTTHNHRKLISETYYQLLTYQRVLLVCSSINGFESQELVVTCRMFEYRQFLNFNIFSLYLSNAHTCFIKHFPQLSSIYLYHEAQTLIENQKSSRLYLVEWFYWSRLTNVEMKCTFVAKEDDIVERCSHKRNTKYAWCGQMLQWIPTLLTFYMQNNNMTLK